MERFLATWCSEPSLGAQIAFTAKNVDFRPFWRGSQATCQNVDVGHMGAQIAQNGLSQLKTLILDHSGGVPGPPAGMWILAIRVPR